MGHKIDPDQHERAEQQFAAFNRLYGITSGKDSMGFIRCNTRILNGTKKKPGKKWSTQPGKRWWTDPSLIIRRIVNDMARQDPHFAWGITPRYCQAAWATQMEYDFDAKDIPGGSFDESFLDSVINQECLGFLRLMGCTPHFIFTGGRSVHCAFYFARPIPIAVLGQFTTTIHGSLLSGGKPDKHLFISGMRLPLSIHQTTGAICRYAGTHDTEGITDYARSIVPDPLDEQDLYSACNEWQALHPASTQAQTEKELPVVIQHSVSDNNPNPRTHIDIVSGLSGRFGDRENPVISTRLALGHPRREEYECYLRDGIPPGRSWVIIRDSDFIFWALHKLNSKQRVWDTLSPVLACGIEDEPERCKQRRDLLEWKLRTFNFRPVVPSATPKGDVALQDEEIRWLSVLHTALSRDFRDAKANRATHCR